GTNASLTVNDGLEQLDRFGVIRDGRPLVSSWYLPQFLTHQLGIFWGLVVNDVLCRLVAFAGTWLLLRRLSIGLRPPLLIVTLLACAFSALEFWPQSDLSVAGVPIALLALLKLRERQHPLLWCGV